MPHDGCSLRSPPASIVQFAIPTSSKMLFSLCAILAWRMLSSDETGGNHDRPCPRGRDHRVLRPRLGVRALLREALMGLEYDIGLILSVLLLAYLVYSLIKPERF
jgi:K+-transporting ATPase KdpF subunit